MSDMDEGTQAETANTETSPTTPEAEKDWKSEAEKWKALSRKHEEQAKGNYSEVSTLRSQFEQQAELLKVLAEKSGVTLDSDNPDKLREQRDSIQAQLKAERAENAVTRKALGLGLDAEALLDSRSFASKLASLDPESSNFDSSVDSLLEEYGDKFKAKKQPPAPKGGGSFDGAPSSAGQQWTIEQVRAASAEELSKAMSAGLLKNLGVGVQKTQTPTAARRADIASRRSK